MTEFSRPSARFRNIFIFLLFIPGIGNTEPDVPINHWIGLIPDDFIVHFGREEDRKNTLWVIPLHEEPNSESESIGTIEVRYSLDIGLNANMISKQLSKVTAVEPHLYENDFTYSTYFHLTVLDREDGWVKIRPVGEVEAVWGNFAAAFGLHNLYFLDLSRDRILTWVNDHGEVESIFVEHVNPDSLIVRDEQGVDMYCGDDTLIHEPYTTRKIPRSSWIDSEHGKSRFQIRYSRGC